MLKAYAPAKINLSLRITGKRADGYHLLQSIVMFADVGDWLEAEPADDVTLTVRGPLGAGLTVGNDNLVMRAFWAIRHEASVSHGARIVLTKQLPVGAGIGGGSADAAAALKLACRLWNVSITGQKLAEIALSLGADVPVCLAAQPCLMEGVGEVLTPLTLPPFHLVLVNPLRGVETAAVFRQYSSSFSYPAAKEEIGHGAANLESLIPLLRNDLLAPAIGLCPAIQDIIAAIAGRNGCLHAGMSGSGATCFGIFSDIELARHAVQSLLAQWPDYWVVSASSFTASP